MLVVVCKSQLKYVSNEVNWKEVKNLLVMPTHELLILGKCNITFNCACALSCSSIVRLGRVLWVHERRAAMSNGKLADL